MPSAQPNRHNSLAKKRPDIASQWHKRRNGSLTPSDVTYSSMKEVWWQCPKSKVHEWPSRINSRTTRKSGCPFCGGKRVDKSNSLAIVSPNISAEWHPTKNLPLSPMDVTRASSKSVWWKCRIDKKHVWKTKIVHRAHGKGCPYCSGNRVSSTNSVATILPKLAAQWHPTKNGNLSPNDLTWGSHQKVWWKCKKRGHEWKSAPSIHSEKGTGSGCPFCSGNKVDKTNSFASLHPEMLKEWHPSKNRKLSPESFTSRSNQRIWWKCIRGHDWLTTIGQRSRGSGCPKCTRQTSRPELRIISELQPIFRDIVHRHKFGKLECDIFIPSLQVGIQYDGLHFHKNKVEKDRINTGRLKKMGVTIFRLRDRSLPFVPGMISIRETSELAIQNVRSLLKRMRSLNLSNKQVKAIDLYLTRSQFWKEKAFLDLSAQIPLPLFGTSFADVHPNAALFWDHVRNGLLTPFSVTPKSNLRVFWICKNGHSYQGIIGDRARGIGCPFCQRLNSKFTLPEDSLLAKNPDLSKEWHPSKNLELTPQHVAPNSNKRIWWICRKYAHHEWQATVSNRNGNSSGCPYCNGKMVDAKLSLAAVSKILAREWHPKLNGILKATHVTPKSKRKVWWLCSSDDSHEWEASIGNRNGLGSGCPHCYRNRKK